MGANFNIMYMYMAFGMITIIIVRSAIVSATTQLTTEAAFTLRRLAENVSDIAAYPTTSFRLGCLFTLIQ